MRTKDKWGFIDKTGAWIVEPKFDDAESFIDGAAVVNIAGKWGYIDKTGAWIVEPMYSSISNFSDGALPVKHAGKWGFIDKTLAVIQIAEQTSPSLITYGV